MNNRGLTVYRASAGSGKTFRLAMEYIKLLVDKPTAYREILAVTFTNKATQEMKMRILSLLYGLWKGLPDCNDFMCVLLKEMTLTQFPNGEYCSPKIFDDDGNDNDGTAARRAFVSERAGMALHAILHDWHHMRVETIDAFFQRVLRGVARELGLATGLTVEIGDVAAVQRAVDALMDGLKGDSALLGWMLGLVEERLEEHRSIFVVDEVKVFGCNIFRDFYKEHARRLNEVLGKKDFLSQYAGHLRAMREQSKRRVVAYADAFEQILRQEGLTIGDFSNGAKGVAGYFPKLRTLFDDSSKMLTKRVQTALEERSAGNWLTKAAIADGLPIVNVVGQKLTGLLDRAEDTRKREARVYRSAGLTLRHLNKLRLLGAIEQKVREMNGESNRFLLSDTQTLLHELMEDGDAPFIFEKMGSQIRHVMIDEFQDTSTVQWRNFKILLNECLSHGDGSGLIVGDVKQSIYRWRSGDWRLLNDMIEERGERREESGEGSVERGQTPIKAETLDTNFRSSRNVVEFNNAFFNLAAEEEQASLLSRERGEGREERGERIVLFRGEGRGERGESIVLESGSNLSPLSSLPSPLSSFQKAYSHVRQHVPANRAEEGYVQICLLPTPSLPSHSPSHSPSPPLSLQREEYEEETFSRLKACIEKLIGQGVAQEDIAILVRYNKTIEAIANRLTQEMPQLSFVSDEAFRIDASVAVNIVIDALRLLANGNDTMAAARLEKAQVKYLASSQIGERGEWRGERGEWREERGYFPIRGLYTPLSSKENYTLSSLPSPLSSLPSTQRREERGERREEGGHRYRSLPLYELVEALYRDLNLQQLQNENAYVCAFFDLVGKYLEDHTSDINAFLKNWDESLHENTVQSDSTRGIRLLTIHKSKGLEFDHVLMPFCDWELERRSTLLWCEPKESPYDELPIVPIDYGAGKMKETIYEADYEQEHLQRTVDNLNLLYVAFTRASKSLYVWGKRNDSGGRSLLIEKTMGRMTTPLPSCIVAGNPDDKESELTLTYGSPVDNNENVDENVDNASDDEAVNVFKQEEVNVNVEVRCATDNPLQFRQSNQSRQFVEALEGSALFLEGSGRGVEGEWKGSVERGEEGSAKTVADNGNYIKTGNILHFVFSTIRTASDIDPTIQRLESEGLLAGLDMSVKSLRKLLHQRIEDPKAAAWFDGKWKVYNECSIIWADPNTGEVFSRRPDRVISDGNETIVIDFKFAKPITDHKTQVQKYMGLLGSMGHQKVKGYLWYVFSNNIVDVP